jgi:hypothetical protein
MLVNSKSITAAPLPHKKTVAIKLKNITPSDALRALFAADIREYPQCLTEDDEVIRPQQYKTPPGIDIMTPYNIDHSVLARGDENALKLLERQLVELDNTGIRVEITVEVLRTSVQKARKLGIQIPSGVKGTPALIVASSSPDELERLRSSLFSRTMEAEGIDYSRDIRSTSSNACIAFLADLGHKPWNGRHCTLGLDRDELRVVPRINPDRTITIYSVWPANWMKLTESAGSTDTKYPLRFTRTIRNCESFLPGGFVWSGDEAILLMITARIL